MARGKMAARAAGRRAAEASDELAQARAEVARLTKDMKTLEVAHRAELQSRSREHQANLDALVQERLDAAIEASITTEVERRWEMKKYGLRVEIATTFGEWIRRWRVLESIKVGAAVDLVESLQLGHDIGVVGPAGLARNQRRANAGDLRSTHQRLQSWVRQ